MKKQIIILAAFFAAALLISGCNPEYTPGLGGQELKISLYCDEPETKADPENPFAFENAIEHFDFFFFKDAEGTQPIAGMHGRVIGSEKVLDTREGGEFSALRKGISYVYILANYPGDHPTGNKTLAQLLALEVEAPIITAKEKKQNPITGDMEETGNVTYCSSLVMDSYQKATGTYTTALSPQAVEEERTVTIGLSRLAAKLALTINVTASVPGSMTYTEGGTIRQEVWTPVLNDLHAYFVNALNNRSTVSAEPIRRSEIAAEQLDAYEYLTYPTLYALTPDAGDDHKFTTAPAYTYPQEWDDTENGEPYFKIQIPWESSLRGTANFYYKIALPKSENNKRTLNRNTFYQVTVDLSVIDTENEYVELNGSYVVTPWLSSGWTGEVSPVPAQFFSVPRKQYDLANITSIAVPYYSSSAIKAYFKNVTYSYYGASNGVLATYEFNNSDDTKTTWTLPTTDSNGKSVASSARDSNEYSLTWDSKNVTFQHSLTSVYTERTITFVIESEGEREEVTIVQHPAIEIKTKETINGFLNGWFARATKDVQDADGNLMGVGPYHATRFGGGDFYHSTTYWVSENPRLGQNAAAIGNLGILYGDCTTSVSAGCMFITEVTVKAFDPSTGTDSYTITYEGTDAGTYTRHFRVGDPRVPAGARFDPNDDSKKLPNYLYSDRTHRDPITDAAIEPVGTVSDLRAWEKPMEILIADQDASANEVIAPRFLVSSNFNNMSSWPPGNANCVRRAATYQENGYPAGRWRLPTEAEINFMMTLQQKGIIPQLYAYGSSYQCANGRAVKITNDGARTCVDPRNCYNRFVYDLWYWGDEPMDPNVYHPNMHEHTNN